MKTTLTFDVSIDAPRKRVWDIMLAPDTYRRWTSAFCEGSYYEGSWEQGETIRFLSPNGDGMVAVIKGNQPYELISIEHRGTLENGVEKNDLPHTPFYEDYRFMDEGKGTALQVSLDTLGEYENFMSEAFPKALAILKRLCEEDAGARGKNASNT